MPTSHIYCMPGLAAGPEIFYNLNFEGNYKVHYLEWLQPLSLEETLVNYAGRMCLEIKHENPILIGVSFGGVLVQEMSKIIKVQKVIIISSVKSTSELPTRFTVASKSKIYKLFPTSLISNFEDYAKFFIGKSLEKKAKLYKKYLAVRDELYLKWSIHNAINWKQEKAPENITHIHGTADTIFPVKHIKEAHFIKDGTHAMVITRAKEISKIIHESLTQ